LYDLATGKAVQKVDRLSVGPTALAFSPDGKTLAWGGWREPAVPLVELATGRERHRFVGQQGQVWSLAFSADGKALGSGSVDTTAVVWDLTGGLVAKGAWGRPLSVAELDGCWAELAGADAARAYQAVRRLAASPAEMVPYLRKRLPAVDPADE